MESGEREIPVEQAWLIAANVVRWRRYGEGGQELRPGTKSYRGGSKVYVIQSYAGTGHEQLTTIGRGRHTGTYITIDMSTRNLHTFRAVPVHSPTVLRLCEEADVGGCWTNREDAEELAARLGPLAAEYRTTNWATPHPTPCRCQECLTLSRG
ncbi:MULTISPECIES: hypothetical protein [Streptomyces]|uniref:hypothetical protein n=1 Tax=Streptomyces TaxID=1883 RepID=UPI0006B66726|nr:hypothetical protein [Streptomyces sp. NRRL S-4]KPC78431.1 hypothetical protein ADK82_30875 [Streptomyces sp. NRRL S-4]